MLDRTAVIVWQQTESNYPGFLFHPEQDNSLSQGEMGFGKFDE